MKRVLVYGGAGFLGSHLCERLLNSDVKVLAVDNFYTGSPKNVAEFLSHPNFELIEQDILTPLSTQVVGHVEEIYNLACPASPPHYQRDPIYTTKISVLGVLNLLEFSLANGCKFFQASTSEVYGDPLEHPQKESYWGNVNCTGIRSCYDEGKRCAETLTFDFHRQHQLPVKVVRIFNTYGPKMDRFDGRVVSNFIVQALSNEDITVYGDGSQTRSFCFVDDLIEGFLRLMASPEDFVGPMNLGNPNEFTVLELAKKVIELTGSKSRIVFKPLPQDDPVRRRPDISLAREQLKWAPETSLEAGLKKTIGYFSEKLARD